MRSWTDNQLIKAVKDSKTYCDVCRKLGISVHGANNKTIKRYIKILNLDTQHFSINKPEFRSEYALKDILANKIPYTKAWRLKERLIKAGLIKDECSICKQRPTWKGQSLQLPLDHIDDNHNNNNLSNLRVLCPNCHSQTTGFAGRKINKAKQIKSYPTAAQLKSWKVRRKVKNRPNKKTLQRLVKKQGFTKTGKQFNVCSTTIKKWLGLR